MYAKITGTLILSRRRNSPNTESVASSSGFGIVYVEPSGDFGSRAEVSSGCFFELLPSCKKGGSQDGGDFGEEGGVLGSGIVVYVLTGEL